jgi:aspartyl/asparaginyl-tRNA synthetase
LLALIREAIHAEVEAHFKSLEDKTALIEASFASIALRVKEKREHEAQEKPRLKKERSQQEARDRAIISRLEAIEGRLDTKLLEAKKPQRPRTWKEARERLEAEGQK